MPSFINWLGLRGHPVRRRPPPYLLYLLGQIYMSPSQIEEHVPSDELQLRKWLETVGVICGITEVQQQDPALEDKLRVLLDQLDLYLRALEESVPFQIFRPKTTVLVWLQELDLHTNDAVENIIRRFVQQRGGILESRGQFALEAVEEYKPSQHFQPRGNIHRILGFLHFSVFNPAPAPEHQELKDLEAFRIETEFFDDYIIQRCNREQSISMERWRTTRGSERFAEGHAFIQEETSTSELRVVKRVRVDSPGSSYINEMQTYIALRDQPYLFAIFGGWYWDGRYVCITMEHFEHGTLLQYMKDNVPQGRSNAREIITQILNGLKAIYATGLCTCPVHPEDVFVSSLSPIVIKLGNLKATNSIPMVDSSAQNIRAVASILYWILASPTPFSAILWNMLRFDYSNSTSGAFSNALRTLCVCGSVIDLIEKLSTTIPKNRLSVSKALGHPWITESIHVGYELKTRVLTPSTFEYGDTRWTQVKEIEHGVMGGSILVTCDVSQELRAIKGVDLEKHHARQMEYDRELEILDVVTNNRESFAQFFGWYQHDYKINFVVEYSKYGDLEQYLDLHGSDQDSTIMREIRDEIGEIVPQILRGLSYLQENGISYRDFRPKNIFLISTFPMRVKLFLGEFESKKTDTHPYIAPELLNLGPAMSLGGFSTTPANMWSLGCLLYKVLTLEDLFSIVNHGPVDYPTTPPLDVNRLKAYCNGNINLPITALENSPVLENWAIFLKSLLDPDPIRRKTPKEALSYDIIRVFEVTYPHRWKVSFWSIGTTHRTHRGDIMRRTKKTLDGGNMGTVSVMEQFVTGNAIPGTQIAVKAISKINCSKNKINYMRELLMLIELKGNVDLFVQFLGWYEDSHTVYLAMEYIEYGDLAKYLQCKGPDVRLDAKEIVTQLLEGLGFLHDRGICHRDLKPQNVLMASTSPVRVKLADFGLSKSAVGSKLQTVCGTEGFHAPELRGLLPPKFRPLGNPGYTHAVDIWSLGCLVHQILTLELPFLEADQFSETSGLLPIMAGTFVNYGLLQDFCYSKVEFPDSSLRKASTSDQGIDFVKRLLLPDPKKRICVADALKHDWLSELDVPVEPSPPSKSQTVRTQFRTLGIHISQRTADNLVIMLDGRSVAGDKYYLPTRVLKDLKALRIRACREGLAFLLRILLRIRCTSVGASLDVNSWSLNPNTMEGNIASIADISDRPSLLQAAVVSENIETIQLLLGMGIDANETSPENDTATTLQIATTTGSVDVVELLLDNGAAVNDNPSDIGGRTSLQAAAGAGHLNIVKLLLERGADCNGNPSHEQGRTAIQAAAEAGHVEIVLELLKHGALINATPCAVQGRTALQAAVGSRHIDVALLLLENGADVNSQPSEAEGRSALQAAAESGNPDMIQLLLRHGAEINGTISASYGLTTLQAAAASGSTNIVELLLTHGANINALPSSTGGRTALQIAAEYGFVDIVNVLLERGADVNDNSSKRFGLTALQAAAGGGFIDIVEILIEQGADLEASPADTSGRTALQAAAFGGHIEVVKHLLEKEAEVESKPCLVGGRTALQAAAQNGHLDIVKLLLDKDADPNAQPSPKAGRTALRAAAEEGHLEVVRVLLEYNADPEHDEWMAERAALNNGHEEVAKLIASWE